MFKDLLPFYNKELFYIRHLAQEFANTYPKIAGHLKLSHGEFGDPHIERLVQAFAFLSARIHLKLEDDFPEINQAFLNVLYPHYLAPIPSFSIVKFTPLPDLSDLYSISKETKIVSSGTYGDPCHFLTCYPVSLWPFDVDHASFKGKPGHLSVDPFPGKGTRASLKFTLKSREGKPFFSYYDIKNLRFFINGSTSQSRKLYDLISANIVGLLIKTEKGEPILLSPDSIKLAGFSEEENILSYSPRSSLGYRLLIEYFVFPEKFLFFDIVGLTKNLLQNFENILEIYIYFNKTDPLLESRIMNNNFLLGCTPIVNLFQQNADPISLTHTTSEIRVIPDARRLNSIESYSISQVTKVSSHFEETQCVPYFGINHTSSEEKTIYWYPTRRKRENSDNKSDRVMTDLYISLLDRDFNPWDAEDSLLEISLLCSNADLPSLLPFNPKDSFLQLEEGSAPIEPIISLIPFTAPIYPPTPHATRWELISHLSLNHLSLTNNKDGLTALKEILRLYDYKNSSETQTLLNGISKISTQNVTRRCPGIAGYPICQGIDITLEVDEMNYQGASLFLFFNILDYFFSYYCNINSFTQLSAKVAEQGFIKKWPPRIGNKTLL